MIFSIMGFHPGKDELVFEKCIGLSEKELIPVMKWTKNNEYVGADFRLTAAQASEIERLAFISFPEGLDFYLTSSE